MAPAGVYVNNPSNENPSHNQATSIATSFFSENLPRPACCWFFWCLIIATSVKAKNWSVSSNTELVLVVVCHSLHVWTNVEWSPLFPAFAGLKNLVHPGGWKASKQQKIKPTKTNFFFIFFDVVVIYRVKLSDWAHLYKSSLNRDVMMMSQVGQNGQTLG